MLKLHDLLRNAMNTGWKKNIQFSVLILYLLEALGALSYLRPSVRDIFADLLFQLYATHQRQIK